MGRTSVPSSAHPAPASALATPVAGALFALALVLVWFLFLATRGARTFESQLATVFEGLAEADRAWMNRKGIRWPMRRSWRDYRLAAAGLVAAGVAGVFLVRELPYDLPGAPQKLAIASVLALTGSLLVRHLVRVDRLARIRHEAERWTD